jgi:hypothetical protein
MGLVARTRFELVSALGGYDILYPTFQVKKPISDDGLCSKNEI